jgi:hypothetical protein
MISISMAVLAIDMANCYILWDDVKLNSDVRKKNSDVCFILNAPLILPSYSFVFKCLYTVSAPFNFCFNGQPKFCHKQRDMLAAGSWFPYVQGAEHATVEIVLICIG